jgi:hypothetical protein
VKGDELARAIRVIKEKKLDSSEYLDKATISKLHQEIDVEAIVTGSIAYLGSSLKVSVRIAGVPDAKVFAASSRTMYKGEFVSMLLLKSRTSK